MAETWDAFPDAGASPDRWAGFPDESPHRKRAEKPAVPLLPAPNNVVAVDADTLDADGNAVRVWGIDAPELSQPGYTREGGTTPAGQLAREMTADLLGRGAVDFGPAQGQSFGRTVAPVTVDDADLGRILLRQGGAFAAHDFLTGDQARLFEYLQAERLARANRLGPVNDAYVRDPAEHRADPGYVVPRETVAGFFDTPTPRAGMRPEVERQFYALLNDPSATPEQVAAYARANGGFVVDPAEVEKARERSKRKGQPIGFGYTEPPKALTDLGDDAAGAAVRGIGEGFVAGGLAELGAFPDLLGLTPGRENVWNSDRRWADIWANNQAQNEAILGYDELAHPYASTAGEVGGAVMSGFAIPFGAGARTVPQLARVGAAYGGTEGFLGTDGGLVDRTKGAVIGAPVGAAVNAVGGKAIEAAAPLLTRAGRKIAQGFRRASDRLRGRQAPDRTWEAFPDAPDGPSVMAMEAEPMPSVSGEVQRPQRLDQPLSEAQQRAALADLGPADVLPISSNVVGSVEEAAARDAGRIVPAKAPDEREALTRRTVRNHVGAEVSKVGPIDLVGFVRLKGGLADQGGELSAMGIRSNAGRKGLDFVGQEQRFGPMVSDTGLTLDDAAEAAWEAGYFPELAERPTINQFLDALRETYEGGAGRRFLPEDAGEIEAFHGRQAERYDLEQQRHEAGGDVYVDRSTTADDAEPFPPPEAFEDWPAEPVRRAGNINLDKLETPQDIRRALAQTERHIGFDAATRGRVTQAETERLASELGMTAEQLLSRRKGQAFNAEEALAARQILAKSGNELVNLARRVRSFDEPGDELLSEFRKAWMRHVAIQEQVAGATAEAGRALAQFKVAAKSRMARGNVLDALVRRGGGRDNLKDAAETILEASERGPGVFNVTTARAAKPKWHNRLTELYINNLLSNPATHVVNTVSNTLTALAQIPEYAAASAIGKARQALPDAMRDRVIGSEVGSRAFGLLQGAKEGASMFARALRTGEASDFISKVEGDEYKAIPGPLGELIRLPTRFLTAEDEFFKGVARRMELNGQAVRQAHREGLRGEEAERRIAELVSNPTDEMLEQADRYGRYLTFQSKLGPGMSKVSGLREDWPGLALFVPFVRTPANLLKFAAERSPAAPLLKEWRNDIKAGGARRDLAFAKALVGTGFGMAIYEAALDGRITGSPPSDPKKARLLYADGWQPYSIKIGDQYYSYKRLDPFSTTLGVAADLATLPENMSERQKQDKATLLVASILGNLANKTWMSGVSDVVSAMTDPERSADNLVQRLVGSLLVPAGVAGVARHLDPTMREVETVGDAVKGRIPLMRDDLPPRRDIWGEVVKYSGGVGPDFLSPVYTSEALNDPVNQALLPLDYAPGYPSRKVGGRELSAEEYDRYQELAGQTAHADLTALVTSPEWQDMDPTAKVKAARKAVSAARRAARETLFEGGDSWDDFDDGEESAPRAGSARQPPSVRSEVVHGLH